ncbi:phosphotransferase [Ekhidna sp.]|uniref:phosphotransferase n=1 Tax=Ekhidna sp. TaxID=2608089 RepID=UPI003BAD12F7
MQDLNVKILEITGAKSIICSESVQRLWSGYGEIRRYYLKGGKYPSIIVKHIRLPNKPDHPKGWNTSLSHQRKLTSYLVERKWYQNYTKQTNRCCRTPQCYHAIEEGNELLLIMEDLDASGYDTRIHHDQVSMDQAKVCLSWLAHFHATFMGVEPEGLWPVGTYWHLETRLEELESMQNDLLKSAAKMIDAHLTNAKYQTLVHGDAKLANFCFGATEVAAVDFQYVGKGCGMKDVAYFISSCFEEKDCEIFEMELLDHYFNKLEVTMDNTIDFQLVKKEWSELYRYAWADFYRFLDGWSPGHWKINDYSKKLTNQVIKELNEK